MLFLFIIFISKLSTIQLKSVLISYLFYVTL